jgi:DNA-binding transcriptional MerR regulator
MKKDFFYAGELAEIAGVSTDTLRYYEKKGVLTKPPRTNKGYRLYPASAVGEVRRIRAALSIGFGIDELADIFRQRKDGKTPCREVRNLAAGKLSEVERRLKELQTLRLQLKRLVGEWDVELKRNEDGECVKLLEKLAASEGKP